VTDRRVLGLDNIAESLVGKRDLREGRKGRGSRQTSLGTGCTMLERERRRQTIFTLLEATPIAVGVGRAILTRTEASRATGTSGTRSVVARCINK
jgi:hypothetical protein